MPQYIGKLKPFGQYESLKGFIKMTDKENRLVVKANEKGYVNIIINKLRAPDERGNTHSIQIDEWKPENKVNDSDRAFYDAAPNNDGLPF